MKARNRRAFVGTFVVSAIVISLSGCASAGDIARAEAIDDIEQRIAEYKTEYVQLLDSGEPTESLVQSALDGAVGVQVLDGLTSVELAELAGGPLTGVVSASAKEAGLLTSVIVVSVQNSSAGMDYERASLYLCIDVFGEPGDAVEDLVLEDVACNSELDVITDGMATEVHLADLN